MKPAASLMTVGEPGDGLSHRSLPSITSLPLLRLGFRPLYLGAALFALLSIPLWLLSYSGVEALATNLDLLWHMHEMVFGFAVAVVVGFLFTAARNWTGLPTPKGGKLGAIAGIWMIGRMGMLLPYPALRAVLDLLFLPAAMVPLFSIMWRAKNHKNLPLLGLLGLLFLADIAFHAQGLGLIRFSAMDAIQAAVLVLAVLSTVVGGRVIPMFTSNMAPASQPRSYQPLEATTIALTLVASLAWVCGLTSWITASCALTAGVVQLLRLMLWSPHHTARYPLLWILHLAVAWIAGGYLMLAAASLGLVSVSSAMHTVAVGGVSSLILGMMTRTTLGHTGRALRADHHELLIFVSIQCAALARVLANIAPLNFRNGLLAVAGMGWVVAFGTYAVVFGPFLCEPRLDGRDG